MNSTPKEECEALMNAFLPFAEKMLAQHGEFYPVGGAMQVDGSIAAVATYDGDEQPPSQKIIDWLMEAFRAGAQQKKYKATALISDICTVPPGATEKTDAVAVALGLIMRLPSTRRTSHDPSFSEAKHAMCRGESRRA